jgi:hypothetical protein
MERSEMFAISPAEAVLKAKEDNKRLASAKRIPDQNVLEDHEAAEGIQLHHNELIRRIQVLNPKILITPGGIDGAVAVRYPKYEFGAWSNEYITGFYLQPLPEFSSVTVDVNGLPHREIRGWRSVLIALIKAGALEIKQVDALFGPAKGQRTGLWYRSLQAQGKNL